MVVVGDELGGALELRASVRPDVRGIVQGLRERGIRHIAIISGDHEAPTRRLAEEPGMDRYFAQVLPADKADYVEQLAGRRRGLRSWLPFAGPAVIASVAYMDPGNFATNIQAGAKYNYNLLWVVVVANVIAMLFQALSAKLGIVTGRNLAELCREQFPQPLVWAMWVVSEISAMATDLADFSAAPSAFLCCWACRCSPAW
jgi:Natural resistance-associated macrophage protein/haloacid dehalogenase-like hydrolase